MHPTPLNGDSLYFAYGENLNRAHMALWCPDAVSISRATLADHRLVFRPWTDIVPSPGDRVLGALYEIGPRDLAAIDEYEEVPVLYQRIHVTVQTDSGPIRTIAYQMTPGHPPTMPPEDYLNLILQGYQDWELDTSALTVIV